MDCIGKLISVTQEWMTGKTRLLFEIDDNPTEEFNELMHTERLTITAKKWRQKRSLDANAMLWSCLGGIAHKTGRSAWDEYLDALKKYGQFTYVIVKENAVEAVKRNWRECQVVGDINVNGTKAVQMLCFYGSSTYNSKEFSILLNGVISDMKDLGLQPPPTREMRMVLERLEKRDSKTNDTSVH